MPAVPLKGVVLAQQLYGHFGRRHRGDIDVLIDAGNLQLADQMLAQLGYHRYEPTHWPTGAELAWWMRFRHHFTYVNWERGHYLELHWKLQDDAGLVSLPTSVAAAASETVLVANCRFRAFPLDFLYRYLLIHGSRSRWARLAWMVDALTCRTLLANSNASPSSIGDSLFRHHLQALDAALITTASRVFNGVSVNHVEESSKTKVKMLRDAYLRTMLAQEPVQLIGAERLKYLVAKNPQVSNVVEELLGRTLDERRARRGLHRATFRCVVCIVDCIETIRIWLARCVATYAHARKHSGRHPGC